MLLRTYEIARGIMRDPGSTWPSLRQVNGASEGEL